MIQHIAAALLGLALGVTLCAAQGTNPRAVRQALALRGSAALKTVLATLGFGMLMTAFLAWLAVIDVDLLRVAPLDGATLLGGLIFGLSLALGGYTPGTALVSIGGGQTLEALCAAAGCLAGAALLPLILPLADMVRPLMPSSAVTLFRVTLDEPYLWQGGFLGQGCLGAVLLALALYVPMPVPQTSKAEADEALPEQANEVETDEVEAGEALPEQADEAPHEEDSPEEEIAAEEEEYTEEEKAAEVSEEAAKVPSGKVLRPCRADQRLERREALMAHDKKRHVALWVLHGTPPEQQG